MIGRSKKTRGRLGKAATRLVSQLPSFLALLGRLMVDARVPFLSKALVAGVALYVVSPLDLIPDIFGLIGLTDDLFLIAIAVRSLVTQAGEEVVRSNWRGTDEGLETLYGSLEELGDVLPSPVRKALTAYGERW